MSAEESKLVEEVVETSEATETKEVKDEFNPLAFSEDVYGEIGKTTEAIEEAVEVEEKSEEEEDKEKEDGWGWDSEKEEDSQEDKEEEYNWEEEKKEEKETASEKGLSWNEVGKEIGLDVSNKEEFLKTLNAYAEQLQAQSNAPAPSSQITELRSYLSFSDRDLVGEELKADGIEASDIEDSLDKLEDSGMMKMKAKRTTGNKKR